MCATFLLAGCSPQQQPADDGAGAGRAISASMLLFEEREAGFEAYPVRVLVSAGHVRVDDGLDDGDYILFDRRSATVYNVTHEDRTVLVILSGSTVPALPGDLHIEESNRVDEQAPPVAGRQPIHVTVSANGTLCYQLVQLPGLLEAARAGLAEYSRALGNRQLATADSLLPEQGTPCFLARYAYAPDRPYQGGIPVELWDADGYRRTLVDFSEDFDGNSGLFGLPDSYTVYQLDAPAS